MLAQLSDLLMSVRCTNGDHFAIPEEYRKLSIKNF